MKLIYDIKTNMITSFSSKFFDKFLKNSKKSSFESSLEWANGCTFDSYDYSKYTLIWFLQMKVKMNMQR